MQTANLAKEKFAKLAELFPDCVTETLDVNGKPVPAIDFDQLKQDISEQVVEGNEERYRIEWPGKRDAISLANAPAEGTLRPCREDSVDFDNTKNLYIEGDNLEVLKLLREDYLGNIKMIYIDPPYNTGNDFVYRDNYTQGAKTYQDNSGQTDEEGNRLVTNTESNGRFHTDWLNMIYPRIKVARDLLSPNGLIFISIDDKEVGNLQRICNEIFGEYNFVGNIVWQSRTSISNDDEISTNHNHTLIYSRERTTLEFGGDDIDQSEYVNPDNDPRGPWKLVPIDANHVGGDTSYPITNPKTGVDYYPPNGRIWCYNKETLEKLMADNRIKFGLRDDSSPKRKLFLKERQEKGDTKTPSSLLLDAGTTKTGTTEIMGLFDGEKVFDYPKPTSLLVKLMKYGFLKDNDYVLDFFSGSGTTAHAMWKYSVEKQFHPKFILVQLPENFDETILSATNDAKKTIRTAISLLDKLQKPHYLTEIAKERLRRAGASLIEENPDTSIDVGFRVLKLDSSNMKEVYYTPSEVTEQNLFEDNIKPDRTDEDLLFQVMIRYGIELDEKIEAVEIAGKKVWSVSDGYLMACFDEDVNETTITEVAKQQPTYFVMRDRSLATDNVADNFDQIFKEYSPSTNCRIL